MTGLVALSNYQFDSYKLPSMRRGQTLNESVVLIVSYMFIIFSMVTIEHNFTVGYVSIGILAVYMGFTFLSILVISFVTLKSKLRYRCAICKYHRSRARLQ